MNRRKFVQFLSMVPVSAVALAACGGGGGASATQQIGAQGEQLKFDKDTLTVPSGQQITVTFNNTSTTNTHDWVLANGGDDVASQVNDAAQANGGEVTADIPNVIAFTRILNPGEQEQVQFQAPAAGNYTYLCTVPGHYAAGMKGTLTVA